MKIQEKTITNKKVIQIYINKQELENNEVKEQIKQIKAQNTNVVTFVSGDNETRKVLKDMVEISKNMVETSS